LLYRRSRRRAIVGGKGRGDIVRIGIVGIGIVPVMIVGGKGDIGRRNNWEHIIIRCTYFHGSELRSFQNRPECVCWIRQNIPASWPQQLFVLVGMSIQ